MTISQKDVLSIRIMALRKDILIPVTLITLIVILEHFALNLKVKKNHKVLLTARWIIILQ